MKTCYVISPYSSGDPATNSRGRVSQELMEERYRIVMAFVAQATKRHLHVFSPILYCHPMAKAYDLPRDAKFWEEWNRIWMRAAYGAYLVEIPGWNLSQGVEDDNNFMVSLNKEVHNVRVSTAREMIDGNTETVHTFDYEPLEPLVV